MPILPAEPDYYPPSLWDEPGEELGSPGAGRAGAAWWCLHAKPRQEKAIARELGKQGIAFYLPQVFQENRTPQGRRVRSLIPLFPGYLFLLGTQEDRLAALRGERLVRTLEVADQPSLERDLRQIQRMLASGLPVEPEPSAPVGSRVRIASGPLAGVEGTVIRRGTHERFVAVIGFLGRGATVDLEDWQVERLPEG
jgi:transcriptional antiterminator RfaH